MLWSHLELHFQMVHEKKKQESKRFDQTIEDVIENCDDKVKEQHDFAVHEGKKAQKRSKRHLKYTISAAHGHEKKRPNQCLSCDEAFGQKCSLLQHDAAAHERKKALEIKKETYKIVDKLIGRLDSDLAKFETEIKEQEPRHGMFLEW